MCSPLFASGTVAICWSQVTIQVLRTMSPNLHAVLQLQLCLALFQSGLMFNCLFGVSRQAARNLASINHVKKQRACFAIKGRMWPVSQISLQAGFQSSVTSHTPREGSQSQIFTCRSGGRGESRSLQKGTLMHNPDSFDGSFFHLPGMVTLL